MALERISITLPKDVLDAADKRARALDRSRSWVIVEAIRAYGEPTATPNAVTSPGLGPLRLAQLEADLRLTPERRVHAAEETVRLGESVRGVSRPANRLIAFDQYEDYVQWKQKEQILR